MRFSGSAISHYGGVAVGALLFGLSLMVGCQSSDDSRDDKNAVRDTVSTSADLPPDSIRTPVVTAVRGINRMRSQLATTFDPDSVSATTFERVCKPVGQRAKSIARDSGWVVQQLARKYRNPAHKLDPGAAKVYARFEANPADTSFWQRTALNDAEGWRYFRRITVEPSCLACHGPKESRPDFVLAEYPDDRAYGFSAGDLRGLYAVFVPDVRPPQPERSSP